jgi:hypothetical protein
MTDDQCISIVDYLQSKTGFNDSNFTTIRDQYQQENGDSFSLLTDESVIKNVARHLKIKIDTDEDLDLLCDCVRSSNVEDSRLLVKLNLKDRTQPHGAITVSTTATDSMLKYFRTNEL